MRSTGARLTVLAGKYAENAPVATGCCMACRTCVTSNLLGLALVPVLAVASVLRRRFERTSLG